MSCCDLSILKWKVFLHCFTCYKMEGLFALSCTMRAMKWKVKNFFRCHVLYCKYSQVLQDNKNDEFHFYGGVSQNRTYYEGSGKWNLPYKFLTFLDFLSLVFVFVMTFSCAWRRKHWIVMRLLLITYSNSRTCPYNLYIYFLSENFEIQENLYLLTLG